MIITILPLYLYLFNTYRYESLANYDLDKDGIINSMDDDIDGDGIRNLSYRGTRNLYRYCELNNRLIEDCLSPQVGDLVFYGRYHIALVSEVHEDGTYNEIEASPWTIFVVEHKHKKWETRDVGRIL